MLTDISLTISELAIFLAEAIRARKPVLVQGAPGLGKSDGVLQAARLADADVIMSHPALGDPTDVKGLPWVVGEHATFLPFGELQRAINATRRTVWFWDDLGQASLAVQASYMQLLLARCVNEHVISDHVTIIAATNRRIDRAGVSGILEPVKSRFTSIVELRADLESWCNWALDHDVPADLIAFLRFTPDLLSAFVPTNDLVNSPSPRTWANAADVLRMNLPPRLQHIALAGAVGDPAATKLQAFRSMIAQLPNIDLILASPRTAPLPTSPSCMYAVATALAYRATSANFAAIVQYCDRLYAADHGEFAVVCIRDCERRHPEVRETVAYVNLVTGPYGQLVSGGAR